MKQKRKHPNVFDVIFIVLIVLLALGAYWISHRSDTGNEQRSRTYVVELTGLDEAMAQYVSVGDPVTDNVKNYEIGTIEAIEVTDDLILVTDQEDGIVREVAQEGYITLLLTIRADTVESEMAVETVSGYTLRTGTSVSISAGSLTSAGYILNVER